MSADRVAQAPGLMIASQIQALARGACVNVERGRAWASITFSGTRYGLSIEWPDGAGATALQELARILPEQEFVIPGYFVADIVITDQSDWRMLIEILCIVDPLDAPGGC